MASVAYESLERNTLCVLMLVCVCFCMCGYVCRTGALLPSKQRQGYVGPLVLAPGSVVFTFLERRMLSLHTLNTLLKQCYISILKVLI